MQFQLTTAFCFFLLNASTLNDVQIYNNCVMSLVSLQNQSIIITFHTDKSLFIVLLLILARNCIHHLLSRP